MDKAELIRLGFVPMVRHSENYLISENGTIYNVSFKTPKAVNSKISRNGYDREVFLTVSGTARKKSVCNLVYQYFVIKKSLKHVVRKIDPDQEISPSNIEIIAGNSDRWLRDCLMDDTKKAYKKNVDVFTDWNGGDSIHC